MFELRDDRDCIINQMDAWPRPKREDQWKPCRSAMEFARFWTETLSCGTVPPDYTELLCPKFPGLTLLEGRPERTTSLPPKGSVGSRTHDLHLRGTWPSGSMTVCVEAKADESFKETIRKKLTKAEQTLNSNPRSQEKRRLEDLLDCVWGVRQPTASQLALRYQLLHALVGTAIQTLIDVGKAEEAACGTGVLLIHVFETGKTERKKLKQNQEDLEKFTRALPNVTIPASGLVPGFLYGTAKVTVPADFAPSGKATPVDVYLAKIITILR